MKNRKLYLIFHGRFPNEKAASLFAAKSAEAFAEEGIQVTLVVPRRLYRDKKDPYFFYKIKKNFRIVYIPTLDFFAIPILGRVASYISFLTFSFFTLVYLLCKANRKDIIYSNEAPPLYLASFFFPQTVYELHDFPEHKFYFYKKFFNQTKVILCTNIWKYEKIQKTFHISKDKLILEQNAVEVKDFDVNFSKEEARNKLNLPLNKEVVIYTGHLYGWKGVDTLAEATRYIPESLVVFVGGTEYDVRRFVRKYGNIKNIKIIGHRPHDEMPIWQKAADVLVLPNTAKEDISKYYTSPMKLFEYMASGSPVVASDIPSVRNIVNSEEVFFAKPDDPNSFGDRIKEVLRMDADTLRDKTKKAFDKVLQHTWERRAGRILIFLSKKQPL